jgi:hypothetical protein
MSFVRNLPASLFTTLAALTACSGKSGLGSVNDSGAGFGLDSGSTSFPDATVDSGSLDASGPNSFSCAVSADGGLQVCAIYSKLSSLELSEVQQACTLSGGSSVSACPSMALVGCCTLQSPSGIDSPVESCLYTGTPDADQAMCLAAVDAGTGAVWSASM